MTRLYGSTGGAWFVNFVNGNVSNNNRSSSSSGYVRLVRAGQ